MKVYEKPKLIAMSLSGNNRLCGDCAGGITLCNDEELAKVILRVIGRADQINDGVTKSDFGGLFGAEVECIDSSVEGYCKYSATNEQRMIAWS